MYILDIQTMFVEGRNKQMNDTMQPITLTQWSKFIVITILLWLLAGSGRHGLFILEENLLAFMSKALCSSDGLNVTGLASKDVSASLPSLQSVSSTLWFS